MQAWWIVAGLALAVAFLSAVAEHRRSRREGLDRVGWMPWSGIIVFALFAFAFACAVALAMHD